MERDRSYAGKGKPPARFIWFRLPDILGGEPAPAGWVLEAKAPDGALPQGLFQQSLNFLDENGNRVRYLLKPDGSQERRTDIAEY